MVSQRLISSTHRTGKTTVLKVNPIGCWTRQPHPSFQGGAEATPPLNSGGSPPKRGGAYPPEKRGDKVYPSEGNPLKSKVGFAAVRVANRIICNKDGWSYDNCQVKPDSLETKPLASVLQPALTRGLSEAQIIKSWQEAVTTTHGAAVDGLAQDTTKYVVAMFKAKLAEH